MVAQLCSGSPDQAREKGPAGCPEREGQSWFAQTAGGDHWDEGLLVLKWGQSWVKRDELSAFFPPLSLLSSPSLPFPQPGITGRRLGVRGTG